MRAFYGTVCMLMTALAICLVVCNARFPALPPEKALKKTPKDADYKVETPKSEDRGAKLPEIKTVWEKDVFSHTRGAAEKDAGLAATRQIDLELIGVCKFGETSGAVIGSKSRGPNPAPGMPGGEHGKSGRKFYTVGQRLGNGYMLKDVQSDRAILTRGSEELVLRIQFESESSKGRRLASVSVKPVEPASSGVSLPSAMPSPPVDSPKEPRKTLPRPPAAPPMGIKQEVMT